MIEVDKLIVEAMKNHDESKKDALRNLKSAILNFKTQPGTPVYDEAAELGIIKKMVKQLEDSVQQFKDAGRNDLAEHEESQLNVLREFLPAAPTTEEIKAVLDEFGPVDKTKMGAAIKFIKSKLPAADGKVVSDIVKEAIV